MCIFSLPVAIVNSTRIFARLTDQGTQLLAYQMNYESAGENAMILPLPVAQPANAESLRFISLEKYGDFFTDLERGFPQLPPAGWDGYGTAKSAAGAALEVFEVGNYVASFVPRLADFVRLDERFRLPDTTWSQLPVYQDYSFAVFQLAAGTLQPHPMAMEFRTRLADLFFPTVHVHDGEVHAEEEFDHVLYLQHAGFDSRSYGYQNATVADRATGLVRSRDVAHQFCNVHESQGLIDGNLLVHRTFVSGRRANQDQIISALGHPTQRSFNWRHLQPWLLWGTVLAMVIWFFQRRGRVREAASAESQE